MSLSCQPTAPTYVTYEDYPTYAGTDLGVSLTAKGTQFKLWSPAVIAARVNIYTQDLGGEPLTQKEMQRTEQGVWVANFGESLLGKYYTYQVRTADGWLAEAPDIYSVACGANGERSHIIDLVKTNPTGWETDQRPPFVHPTDAVIYELHVRDFSIDENSGMTHKGKFLAFTEKGTTSSNGTPTGIDHLVEMGVTHVHLLPSFDFMSVDETKPDAERNYNWGYDPHLYNVPEGSYSTNPHDGAVRVREFKQMVQALHRAGIRVVLDVVYNHTGATENSVFNRQVPNYYYRFREDGTFSDAAACGNETASERSMVRQFIVQSVRHWVEEYHLDGFRFDLMGIHDQATMNAVTDTLHAIDPSILVYGEGWTAGDSPLPEAKRSLKKHIGKLTATAAFSDDIRDAIKGHVFTHDARGFISGLEGLKESIKFGVVAATEHPQIDYAAVNYSEAAWAPQPGQCVVYASCHDNHTIWDRLQLSTPTSSETERTRMQELALGIVLTSQGISFLHAGSEWCRTKQGEENSYKSPDAINLLDWSRKSDFQYTVDYVKSLIALRRAHPAFRMRTAEQIAENLVFMDTPNDLLVAFTINAAAVGDSWQLALVVYNGNATEQQISLPNGEWRRVVYDGEVNDTPRRPFTQSTIAVPPISLMVLAEY